VPLLSHPWIVPVDTESAAASCGIERANRGTGAASTLGRGGLGIGAGGWAGLVCCQGYLIFGVRCFVIAIPHGGEPS
jgi:hypothetical protein